VVAHGETQGIFNPIAIAIVVVIVAIVVIIVLLGGLLEELDKTKPHWHCRHMKEQLPLHWL
jgi:hypothetical protein